MLRSGLASLCVLLGSWSPLAAQGSATVTHVQARHAGVRFVDVTALRGITPAVSPSPGMGTGAAAADFDDDGDVDLFLPQMAGVPDLLYRNDGGTFTEYGVVAGVGSLEENRTALWVDYDGDHDLDLLVSNDEEDNESSYELFAFGDHGDFLDVTVPSGLFLYAPKDPASQRYKRGGFAAGDLDNNGYLDVFATLSGGPSHLFMNQGDGTFAEVGQAAGVTTGVAYNHWQAMMVDLDVDGWTDIYVAIDFFENALWHNQQDGTFVDVAGVTNSDIVANDMGMAISDVDDDGDFDIHTTNIYQYLGQPVGNVLLRNDTVDGVLWFEDIAPAAGIDDGGWGWGTTFLDFDRDGRQDLAATNGWTQSPWIDDPTRLWRNVSTGGTTAFVDAAPASGMADPYFGSALLAFDYDRDGDQDLFQTTMAGGPVRLLECMPASPAASWHPQAHWVTVRPRMTGTNHFAIGAVVRVTVGGRTMSRLITAGTSFLGQEPAEAHFGLGATDVIDRIEVEFPDGQVLVNLDPRADEVHTVTASG